MKQAWSPAWKGSIQPRKQRKFRHRAPLHVRRRFVSANLSPALRNEFGKRSMPIRKGDEVEVMRGESRKFRGAVDRVDMKSGKIYVEGVKVKKVDGSEVLKALQPSNLRITKMVLDDKKRQGVLERSPKRAAGKGKAKKEEKGEKKGKPAVKEARTPEKTGKGETNPQEPRPEKGAKPPEKWPKSGAEKAPVKKEAKKGK